MKRCLFILTALMAASSALAQVPVITPTNPIVALAGTQQFTCSGGTCSGGTGWACSGCVGSISLGGLYTAPSTGTANDSDAGFQLLPNDHIFNTRIDSLGVNTNSAAWIAGAGTVPVNYLASFPKNYVNGSTPTTSMAFYYTPLNNGTFQCPAWPTINIESGWFDAIVGFGARDHHCITVDTTNGNFGEQYQFYAQAPVTSCTVNGSNSATCTITPTTTSDGFMQAVTDYGSGAFSIQLGSWTGGDTYLNGSFVGTAATHTTITFNVTHGAATTSTSGQATLQGAAGPACVTAGTCNSNSGVRYAYSDYALPAHGATDAAGMFLEPLTLHTQEVVNACANGTAINHALRITLASGFLASSFIWPATTFATDGGTIPFGARARLKAAFAIGGYSACAQKLLTQLKNYGVIFADGGYGWQIQLDNDNTPPAAVAALNEINLAGIATSNWEFVDESTLMESSSSGAVNTGERVCFNSSTGTTCTHVDLQNTAVNIGPNGHQQYVMAGASPFQLPVYSNGAFTCAMSPTVGSLTSGGLYTPPASVTVGTKSTTTVTCTSTVTNTVSAQMIVNVFPATNFNLLQDTADFTDSHGTVWFSGGSYGFGMSNIPSWQGCCQRNGPTVGTDHQLYWDTLTSSLVMGDFKIDVHVPNGVYQSVYHLGTRAAGNIQYFSTQGSVFATVDPNVSAGGINLPFTLTTNATVSNGILSFYDAGIGGPAGSSGDISSISFTQVQAGVPAAPSRIGILLMANQKSTSPGVGRGVGILP